MIVFAFLDLLQSSTRPKCLPGVYRPHAVVAKGSTQVFLTSCLLRGGDHDDDHDHVHGEERGLRNQAPAPP